MKRFIAILLALCLGFSLTACNKGQTDTDSDTKNQGGNTNTETPINTADGESNILIAYFTWADNTVVENPDAVDVDASTSASVLAPGNAAKLAEWIKERTGGDLFSIKVSEPYSSDYDECLDRAADEKADDARPQLSTHVENMEDYDIIFLGFPNWWYTVPMAIHSFVEEYNLSGKTIVPFVTHGTGGLSRTIDDLSANLPSDTTVLSPIGVYRPEVDESQPAINAWLDRLGFTEEAMSAENTESSEKRIIMTVDGQDISILLNDNTAAASLYEMLPLELTFEDYNNVEKISYLTETLTTEGSPNSCDPAIGDFCLYAPWGNLSIFYEDFRESNGLVPLGHIENGMDIISGMSGDFKVTLKAAE